MNVDYHVHSSFSDDSTCLMENEILRAISIGLDEICFTEHVDYGVKTDLNCNYLEYITELNRCKKKYIKQISIKLGIEFGIQSHTIDLFQKDVSRYDFDFIILSCHQVNNKEFWTQEFQIGKSQKEYNERYYEEILNVISNYNDYCVLGHLDLINRYTKEGIYPFEKVEKIIEKILNIVIEQGKGIEVNTSSFRYGLTDLMPSRKILELYKELGGSVITIGSDAHELKDIGYNIDLVKRELKKLNFTKFCIYEKMKPKFFDL